MGNHPQRQADSAEASVAPAIRTPDQMTLKAKMLATLLFLAGFAGLALQGSLSGNPGLPLALCSAVMIGTAAIFLREPAPLHFRGLLWMAFVLLSFAAYLIYNRRFDHGVEKIFTGTLILVTVILCAAFKARKKLSIFVKMGKASNWLGVHIYAGMTGLILLLFHLNFQTPIGLFSNLLFYAFVLSVAVGLLGNYLQKIIPIKLSNLEVEVIYEKIPEIVDQLRERIESLLADLKTRENLPSTLSGFCEKEVLPFFQKTLPRLHYFFSESYDLVNKLQKFDKVSQFLNDDAKTALEEIRELYIEKHQLDVQRSMQGILRQWLWLHIVSSAFLIILIAYHLVLISLY